MDDDDDGFEPLFSYTKQAPVLVHLSESDEEDEKAVPVVGQNKPPEKKQEQKVEKPIAAQKPVDDEDWLLPPPSKDSTVRAPGPLDRTHVLLEIRRKQAELLELAQRAKDIERQAALPAAEAAAQVEAQAVISTTRPAAAAAAAEKILLQVQDKNGSIQSFRISKDDKLDKLFKAYAAAVKASLSQLVFRFDGDQVPGSETPRHLELEDEDILEVFLKPGTATDPAPIPAPVQPSRPQKETVRIKVQDESGHKQAFRIGKDDRFGKLFSTYTTSRKLPSQQLVFRFDGDAVSDSQTPRSLDMEDEDTMEAFLKP